MTNQIIASGQLSSSGHPKLMADELTQEVKDALLGSGLPLEYSAEGVLRRRLFRTVSGDFSFLRPGAQSETSIDLTAEKRLFNESLERQVHGRIESVRISADWKVLVDCKHRNENVWWLFAPYEGPWTRFEDYRPASLEHRGHVVFGSTFSDSDTPVRFATFHPLSDAYGEVSAALGLPPICLRGVESRHTRRDSSQEAPARREAYSAEIRKAAHQLQFAVVPYLWPTVRDWASRVRADAYRSEPSDRKGLSCTLVSAYLVTTAQLFILKPQATIEGIRNAHSLEDIAEPVPVVEFVTSSSHELLQHHRGILSELHQWPQIDRTNPNERAFLEKWEPVASRIEHLSPSITVVNDSQFENCLGTHERALHRYIFRSAASWGRTLGYSWG